MFDVAIVGGGSAGLGAAVTLARSLRRVVVVDAGSPRNAAADGAHNLLGHEGVSPLDLLAAGRREAESYGAQIRPDQVASVRRVEGGFQLELADDETITARRLLLATGLADELPEVPGVRELWGRSVLHCPYCHGWEVRDQRIGVLGTSDDNVHQALLFRQLSEHVTLFRHTMPEPQPEAWEQMSALDISVVDGAVQGLRAEDGVLQAVVLEDGTEVRMDAVVVAPRMVARADLYEQLGGRVTADAAGAFIPTEAMGRTDIPGVWAAGNVSDLGAMVGAASGSGVAAAAEINADLVEEDAHIAVAARAQRLARA